MRALSALFLLLLAAPLNAAANETAGTFTRAEDPLPGMRDEVLGSGLYGHERIYLIGGGRPDFDLKFQVSFKARIWDHVYLGYTQLNAWDISRESSPFRDTTHKLSLFLYPERERNAEGTRVHWSGGFEHNSNGRDGPASRSLDMLYVRPLVLVGSEQARHWRVAVKGFHYLRRSDNNADITRYRDLVELDVANRDRDSWAASLQLRTGREGLSSAQVDVSQRMSKLGWEVPGYVLVQVFHGYGETLLDYNRKLPTQLRVGYLFERGQ